MDTKTLLYGLIGFFIGGLLVSVAATTFDKPKAESNAMSMSRMSEDLKNKSGDDFDAAFISAMIEHHQSAVDMAALVNDRAKHDELKTLAGNIMSSQSEEIDRMQTWQTDWGYKNTPQSHNQDTTSH